MARRVGDTKPRPWAGKNAEPPTNESNFLPLRSPSLVQTAFDPFSHRLYESASATTRTCVPSTMLAHPSSTGIFSTEPGQRFLLVLLRLSARAFGGLYEKCARNLRSSYYLGGLERVAD